MGSNPTAPEFYDKKSTRKRANQTLLRLKPKKSKFTIRVEEHEDHFDKQKYIHVDAYKKNPMMGYAIEFQPWEEWLGMGFLDRTKNEKMALAHCLFEMTFCGFEQKQIQAKRKELERRIEEA